MVGGLCTRRRGSIAAVAVTLVVLLAGASASAGAAELEPRVVGGDDTTIEEWPWQVAIANPPSSGGNGFQRQFCGGSLLASTVVVTAAHCVTGSSGSFRAPSNFSVISGRTMLSSSAGNETGVIEVYYPVDAGTTIEIEAQTPSGSGDELFNRSTLEWDWAILRLASAAGSPAAPIQIASAAEASFWQAGDPAWVTGWGRTSFGGSRSDTLQEAEIEIIADGDCDDPDVYGSEFFAETMVCAGFLAGGVDTCQGDSGGPLAVPIGGGEFRLVGATSWGIGCAQENAPGVYARLADEPMRSVVLDAITAAQGSLPPPDPDPDPDPEPDPEPIPPPPTGTTPTSPTGTAPATTEDADCEEARDDLRRAKRKLRRAKRLLERADTKLEEDRAERLVKRAKRKRNKARAAVAAAC
jgi:trypsin